MDYVLQWTRLRVFQHSDSASFESIIPTSDPGHNSASFESIILTPDTGHDGFASELSNGLPPPDPVHSISLGFTLGELTEADSIQAIHRAYQASVHFTPNTFSVPYGGVGRKFVSKLSKFYLCFGEAGSFASHAFSIAAVFQQLMLQRPHCDSVKYSVLLENRLQLWSDGSVTELLREALTIQKSLEAKSFGANNQRAHDTAGEFANKVS